MTDYDFRALSPVDFELLVRDVLNADLGLRLHSYPAGRDQGIDLRQVITDDSVIVVQCKHYPQSSESTFLRAVKKEGQRGKNLRADRYIFVTSRPLTALQEDKVLQRLVGLPVVHDDVWGQGALNGALALHEEVERRHVKLWIPSTAVLDTLIRSGQWQRSEALLSALSRRAQLWVHTPAYDDVFDRLESDGVCLVSGPPGVGKTFLAGMVLLATWKFGWQVVDITNNVEEAWAAFRPNVPQIFYYDDFLGEAGVHLAKNEPRSLNAFLDRIHEFKESKRILLTTRDYELRCAADGPADQLSELARRPTQYELCLDSYDLQIRAQILFNHLYFSDLPMGERERLAIDNRLIGIVEHPSYNPRIVELGVRLAADRTASGFINAVNRALENPRDLLNASFRRLSRLEQRILLVLATLPGRPWPVETVRKLVGPHDALAWRPALRALETTWLLLSGRAPAHNLTFASPGCRDFLHGVLDDTAVADQQLDEVASLAQVVSLARTAGLLPEPYRRSSGPTRAELASVLQGRRAEILEKVRQFTCDDIRNAPSLAAGVKTLLQTAAVCKAVPSVADTSWLLDLVEDLLAAGSDELPAPDGFELAESLKELPADDESRQSGVVKGLIRAAACSMAALQDLDAFEALPTDLAHDQDIKTIANDRARTLIETECELLLQATDDVAGIMSAALDLGQRAQSYGLEIDIDPILDHADHLAANVSDTGWPDSPGEEPEPPEQDEDPRLAMHQLFLQLDSEFPSSDS